MFQQSEVVSLLLALSLGPVAYASIRRREFPGKRALITAVAAMLVSYVTTVLEGVVLGTAFNLLEHLALAVSGVAFAFAAMQQLGSRRSES